LATSKLCEIQILDLQAYIHSLYVVVHESVTAHQKRNASFMFTRIAPQTYYTAQNTLLICLLTYIPVDFDTIELQQYREVVR
jgi:hypothetical protein